MALADTTFLWRDVDSDPVRPPTHARLQVLPFGELSWENFERLCYRLAHRGRNVEDARIYGVKGQAQEGIDLYVRRVTGEYESWQCKRYQKVTKSDIQNAVTKFLEGDWAGRTKELRVAVAPSLAETALGEEVEVQRARCATKNIVLVVMDADRLSLELKDHPDLVDDFFSREWVKSFNGEEAAEKLGRRKLTRDQRLQARRWLSGIYGSHIQLADPGIPAGAPAFRDAVKRVSIAERYVEPTVELVESIIEHDAPAPAGNTVPSKSNLGFRRRDVRAKMPLSAALTGNDRFLLVAGPGFGKSAALRVIALDLLANQPRFPELAKTWINRLPLLLPFSFLTAHFRDSDQPSVERCFIAWLKNLGAKDEVLQLLTEMIEDDRLLLMVDGLDEWQHQEAAVAALTALLTFVQSRKLALLASGRPAGFDRISEFGPEWKRASLRPLDTHQQRQIVTQWLRHFHEAEGAAAGPALEQVIERDADAFATELADDPGLAELTSVPLLLSVMIYLRLTGRVLPHSRLEALEELVGALIVDQPRRRAQSAMLREDLSARRSPYVRRGLAFLAYCIHGEPNSLVLSLDSASDRLQAFFRDELELPAADADKWTVEVLELGRHEFGVLVAAQHDHVGILHRVFQEYLAAQYLSRLSLERTKAFCCDHGRKRPWHEVTVFLLQMLRRADDVDELLDLLRGRVEDVLDEPVQQILLTRLSVAVVSGSRGKARALVTEAFGWIELGVWMPLRLALVREIVHGLESEYVRDLVAERIIRWFPGRQDFWHDLPKAIAAQANSNTVADLLVAFHNADSSYEFRTVAEALASCRPHDPGLSNRLLAIVRGAGDPELIGGALHALATGWPEHGELRELLLAASASRADEIRYPAILARFNGGDRSNQIRDALASFCRDGAHLWPWEDDIINALATGWVKDPGLTQIAFESLGQRWPKAWNSKLALKFLLRSGAGDAPVAQVIADQLALEKNDRRDLMIFEEHKLLLTGFTGHPLVVPAAEAWLARNSGVNHRPIEVAVAAKLAGTEKARQYLIDWLKRGDGMPAWIISTLWEMSLPSAPDVVAVLEDYVRDQQRLRASSRWLPGFVKDQGRLIAMLRESLREGDLWSWHDALGVLVNLEGKDATGLWASVEERLKGDRQGHFWRLCHSLLIRVWPERPLIRRKAMENVYGEDVLGAHLIDAYGADPEIRPLLDSIVCVLHPDLRVELARALEPLARRRVAGAVTAVASYRHEPKAEARTIAARANAKACVLVASEADALSTSFATEMAQWHISHSEHRQAAVAGLLELGRLDLVLAAREDGKPVRFGTSVTGGHNWEFIASVVEHWDELAEATQDIWARFEHSAAIVVELVKAGKRSAAASHTIAYENHFRDGQQVDDDEVRALIALHGRSEFLRDLFLARLQRFSPTGHQQSMMVIETRSYHAIGAYLAENFRGDSKVHDALVLVTGAALMHDVGWIALCRGWPESPLLLPMIAKLPTLIDATEPITAWLFATKADSSLMARYLLRYPAKLRGEHFGQPRDGLLAIWTRLEADEDCRRITFEGLRQIEELDTMIGLSRLLGPSMRRDTAFRHWICEKIVAVRSHTSPLAPLAFDVLANEHKSVEFCLLQAMLTQ